MTASNSTTTPIFITTLQERPEFFQLVLQQIEESFHYSQENSFKDDFSNLINQENWSQFYLLLKESKLVATLGTLRKHLCFNGIETPILLLGAITVNKDFRGQGHFKNLFKEVLEKHKNEVSLFILWTGDSALYEKFDFYETGLNFLTPITQESKQNFFSLKKNEKLSNKHKQLIQEHFDLLTKDKLCLKRSASDWDKIFSHQSMEIYTKDNPFEYWLVGKGFDLKGICHESNSRNIPSQSAQSFLTPQALSAKSVPQYAGLFKIGNKDIFNQFIKEWSQGRIEISQNKLVFDGQSFEMSEKDILKSLFFPGTIKEFDFLQNTIFFGGYDSI